MVSAGMLMLAPGAAMGHRGGVIRPWSTPLVIAHRGASGERPEHTLAGYQLAIDQGCDVIEPDLVPTSDGVLVARHENEIGGTTDVADHPTFAARRTTKLIDGRPVTGWFTEDFTLAELKTLRARERLPALRPANSAYDGRFEVPTFAEVIALARRASAATGRTIGVYPETKHPTYFAGIGLPADDSLLHALQQAGWDSAEAPVFIQSFEVDNLRRLATLTRVRLIQLTDESGGPADGAQPSYATMTTPAGLREIARYAFGIGPNKSQLATDAGPSTLVAEAHAAGLHVHPWTFRVENQFLATPFRVGDDAGSAGDLLGEIKAALRLGIDGFFTDYPASGVAARDAWAEERS